MNIERTCKITLSNEELRAAITTYIQDKLRWATNGVKASEECLAVEVLTPLEVVVEWGEAPEEEEVLTAPAHTTLPEPALA